MALTSQEITFYAGDTKTVSIPLKTEADGAAFSPASAYHLIFTAKASNAASDLGSKFQYASGVGIVDPVVSSSASVTFHPVDTRDFGGKTLYWDIQAEHETTGVILTVAYGTLVLKRDTTRQTTTSVPLHTLSAAVPYTGPAGPTGPTGPAGPNTVSTSTTTNLTGYIYGNGTTVGGATAATSAATANTLVLRNAGGGVAVSTINNLAITAAANSTLTIDEDKSITLFDSITTEFGGYINTDVGGYIVTGVNGYIYTNGMGYIHTGLGGHIQTGDGGYISTTAGGSFTTGTGNLTGPNTSGTIALTSDIPPAATVDATIINGSANAVSGNAVFDALALKAPLASPTFTGIVTAPRITGRCDGLEVLCKAGLAIAAGQVVYVTGASGNNIVIGLARANAEATSSKTIGISESTLANNATGYVITEGLMTVSISAPTATEGDPIWLSPTTAGSMVFGLANKPSAPNHMVYLGVVTRKTGNTVVEIYVKVQNGFELDELHNVSITSPVAGQALMRGASLWENRALVSADISNATSAATPNTLVLRNASGDASFGAITANSTISTSGAYASISTAGTDASISTSGDNGSIYTAGTAASISTSGSDASISTGGTAAGIYTAGDYATISTNGVGAYVSTFGDDAFISTSGINASISTSGSNADIFTVGDDATISTSGADAFISTSGSNAYIQSRATFKLFNGAHTTTLSHSPTANRAIAFPNASGTVPVYTGTPATGQVLTASGTAGLTNWTSATSAATADTLVLRDASGGAEFDSIAVSNAIYTTGDNGNITTSGDNAFIRTYGGAASINTNGEYANLYTNGANASISTNGVNATIYTNGATASIFTLGSDATIRTYGDNAHISTSGTDANITTSGTYAAIYTNGSDAIISTYGLNAYITTTGAGASIYTVGDNATIFTEGVDASIFTIGSEADIFTSGIDAYISTSGDNAFIYTVGSDASISTAGINATILTQGTNAHIQSRATFKLFNGFYTTTLSHTPTANRAIAFPNKSGTVAMVDAETHTGAHAFSSTTRPTSSGTGTPAATSLITLTDLIGRGGRQLSAQLVADEAGNDNSTTLKTSATLTLALEIGLYHIESLIVVSGGTLFATVGTRQKLAFTGTGTFSGAQTYNSQNGSATSTTYPTTRAANAVDAEILFSANSSATLRHGTLNVTVAGNLVVQWAQRTAGVGSAPTLNPPSYIKAQRIS